MKFNCNATPPSWLEQHYHWERWFAWFPVTTVHGDCRWLEVVYRRAWRHQWQFLTQYLPGEWEYHACGR